MGRKIRIAFFSLLWTAQIVTVVLMLYKIIKLDYFPTKLLFAFAVILMSLTGLTGILLVFLNKRKATVTGVLRKALGIFLAISISAGSIFGANVVQTLADTVDKVTAETKTSTTLGVYVLKSDKAKKLKDVKRYEFSTVKSTDSKKAVKKIDAKLKTSISVNNVSSPLDAVGELYDSGSDTQAIIMNTAYEDVVKEVEKYSDFDDKVKCVYKVSIAQKKVAKVNSDIVKNPFVIYLSGSDTRDEELTTSRSDVNLLMVVNPKTKQILLLNTPRDYYIPNPAGGGALDKLTHCGIYGIEDSIEALSDLYSEDIDYYAQINFSGFEKIVDSLGGIDVDVEPGLEVDTFYTDGSQGVTAGVNHLDGKRALAFARERYAYEEGDIQRGKNQMQVIQKVIAKMCSKEVLKNYGNLLDSISGMFTTNLSSNNISDLVKLQLSEMPEWNIKSYTVNGTSMLKTTYSSGATELYVMVPDQNTVDKAVTLIDKVVDGKKLTDNDVSSDSSEVEDSEEDDGTISFEA